MQKVINDDERFNRIRLTAFDPFAPVISGSNQSLFYKCVFVLRNPPRDLINWTIDFNRVLVTPYKIILFKIQKFKSIL